MRAVDYVIEYIWKELKVNMIFTVTGGGAMFLDDAIAKCENIQAICNHHEQASAMAALGFAKYSNNIVQAFSDNPAISNENILISLSYIKSGFASFLSFI